MALRVNSPIILNFVSIIISLDAVNASKMYGVESEEFLKALLKPRVKVGTEWVNKGQNMEQVIRKSGKLSLQK